MSFFTTGGGWRPIVSALSHLSNLVRPDKGPNSEVKSYFVSSISISSGERGEEEACCWEADLAGVVDARTLMAS